jgi:type II secretory pathway component GspD/PulD (secretin)
VSISARANQSTASERVDQRIQVLDGGHAFISTGESRPIRQGIVTVTPSGRTITQGTEIQSAQTGFDVVPRVSGTQVFLDIAPQRETFGDSGARGRASTVHSQRAATTVSARLGAWFEIGGVAQTASGSTGGIGSSRETSASSGRRIWVRVDEVRP